MCAASLNALADNIATSPSFPFLTNQSIHLESVTLIMISRCEAYDILGSSNLKEYFPRNFLEFEIMLHVR